MATRWKPLQPSGIIDKTHADRTIALQMERSGQTREQAIEALERYEASCRYWLNDLYQVQTRTFHHEGFNQTMMHINIRRRDGAAIFDWRHRQLIKNQLLGDECEAFELYPAESRLVDTSNKYHLWGFLNPDMRISVGIDDGTRDVVDAIPGEPAGLRQRRFLK